jgi:hypothetical protein
MMHEPFASLDEMLSVEAMSDLEGRTVNVVEVDQWTAQQPRGAVSGCEFLKVRTYASNEHRYYFVKRTAYATDLVRRLTDDYECRERLLWQYGVLDRLPAEVDTPMLAHACDGDGWALLMRDISVALQRLERRRSGALNVFSWAQVCVMVDGLAAMHAKFYRNEMLEEPALSLCTAHRMFAWLRPEMLQRQMAIWPSFVDRQATGWTSLDRLDSTEVAAALGELRVDPTPLVKALARYPSTLVHGDLRRENLGLTDDPTPRLAAIDWQFAAALPPTVDFAWLLQSACAPMEAPKERVIDRYHQQLSGRLGSRFDERTWEPQLRLALLGQTVRNMAFALWAAYHQTVDTPLREILLAELPWWTEQARLGLEYL